MKTYTVTLNNIDIEITQDDDGKFIKPTLVTSLESMGTAIKPAHEPIILARKPLSEKTIVANVLKHGTGGINIDGCRVGTESVPCFTSSGGRKFEPSDTQPERSTKLVGTHDKGRFPANLIHDGSEEVVSLFPVTKSGSISPHHKRTTSKTKNAFSEREALPEQ